jgi:hypothetical protein
MRRLIMHWGCFWVRRHDLLGAFTALQKPVILAPDDARYAYVYAVALNSAGKARCGHRKLCPTRGGL